jgi:hypothetical protein
MGRMRFRKLRIAWLGVCGALCILAAGRMQMQMGLDIAPDWLLATLFALLGFVPWLSWPKRFSLRTLLIATTLLAVALGAFVLATRK